MTEGSDGLQVARDWDNYPEHYAPIQVSSPFKQDSQYPAGTSSPPVTELSSSTVCGLSRRTFIVTAAIAFAIVLAGALGGGLGGGLSSQGNCSGQCSSSATDKTPPANETVTVTVSAASTASATPTTGHYSDCPSSNGTDYTSTRFTSGDNGAVPDGAKNGLKFSKICGADGQGTNLAQADFSTFEECIDLCASYNFWSGSTDCNIASYNNEGTCWIKSGGTSQVSNAGVDTAVLADSG
ncbi:hypothetical protein ASPCAL00704 [Aspergillus calidoustus]|uniref:Apple domain-containing protein n=1 Tax=Aspergillus calidoustus TaxID=454130 RepID=A0A0U5FSZ5_ASPCI|nr:hypothetical protein ASPCAL00704 [Aspergillus calidoustus]